MNDNRDQNQNEESEDDSDELEVSARGCHSIAQRAERPPPETEA